MAAAARIYRGPLKAVIFDWAGTIVDFGSVAPVHAFMEVFKRAGVTIDQPIARGPMGLNKRDHIKAILAVPSVAKQWQSKHGRVASEADVDGLYHAFTPIQIEVVKSRAVPIAGAVDLIAALRKRGLKVGSCSGYNEPIMDEVRKQAAKLGLTTDAVTCANAEGTNGRPKPWLSTRVAEMLDVYPLRACVKVDDTLPGILEGLAAGMWTVGVRKTGNELGLDEAEVAALPAPELASRLAAATSRFEAAGAHYVVDSVADLPPILDEISQRMAAGQNPFSA